MDVTLRSEKMTAPRAAAEVPLAARMEKRPRPLWQARPPSGDRSRVYAAAAALLLSKNCSSSVECDSAVVEALLPWTVVVTASK